MHKVRVTPNKEGKKEVKENCENPKCYSKDKTLWVYLESTGSVMCSHCKQTLRGRGLMVHKDMRIKYHMGE